MANVFINESTFYCIYNITENQTISNLSCDANIAAESYSPQLALQIIYLTIATIGFLLNVFTITVIYLYKPMHKCLANTLIANQSLLDALASVFLFFGTIFYNDNAQQKQGDLAAEILCRIWYGQTLMYSMLYSSVYGIVAVAFERYLAVVHPLWHKAKFTQRMLIPLITAVWLIGAGYVVPLQINILAIDSYGYCDTVDPFNSLAVRYIQAIFGFVLLYLFPLSCLTFFYMRMIWTLRANKTGYIVTHNMAGKIDNILTQGHLSSNSNRKNQAESMNSYNGNQEPEFRILAKNSQYSSLFHDSTIVEMNVTSRATLMDNIFIRSRNGGESELGLTNKTVPGSSENFESGLIIGTGQITGIQIMTETSLISETRPITGRSALISETSSITANSSTTGGCPITGAHPVTKIDAITGTGVATGAGSITGKDQIAKTDLMTEINPKTRTDPITGTVKNTGACAKHGICQINKTGLNNATDLVSGTGATSGMGPTTGNGTFKGTAGQREKMSTLRARKNLLKTLITVGIGFIVCWTWSQVYFLAFYLGIPVSFTSLLYKFDVILNFITVCVNPIIYCIQYRQFKNGIKKIVGDLRKLSPYRHKIGNTKSSHETSKSTHSTKY